jgi:ribosomal protein S1
VNFKETTMEAEQDLTSIEGEQGEESMESLLAAQAAVAEKLAGKQVTWVKVIQVTKEAVLVDIGEKREGSVPLPEFGTRAPSVGQRIPVMQVGRKEGSPALSYKRAKAELGWEMALKAHQEKQRVRGTVTSSVKGGFIVDVNGVAGFLPASLADLRPVRNPARMLHTGVRCYIIELNESKKQVVLSRKAVLEEEAGKRKLKLLDELRLGEIRIGRVVHAGPNGLVVDIGGVEGQVKMEDVSWGTPKLPAGIERGSKVRVKVLSKSTAEGTPVYLGLKQLQANPADALRKKFAPKSVVHGKIVEVAEIGLKIKLEPSGQAALAYKSDTDPETTYKAGEPVSAIVVGVDPKTFAVTVSVAKYEEIKDRKRVAQYLKAPPPLTLGQLLSPEKPE